MSHEHDGHIWREIIGTHMSDCQSAIGALGHKLQESGEQIAFATIWA